MDQVLISVFYTNVLVISCVLRQVRLFVTTWTIACQAPLVMEFFRQEYWSGLPFSFCRGSSQSPGIKLVSLVSPALAGRFFTTSTPWKPN